MYGETWNIDIDGGRDRNVDRDRHGDRNRYPTETKVDLEIDIILRGYGDRRWDGHRENCEDTEDMGR